LVNKTPVIFTCVPLPTLSYNYSWHSVAYELHQYILYKVIEFVTDNGKKLFVDWLQNLDKLEKMSLNFDLDMGAVTKSTTGL